MVGKKPLFSCSQYSCAKARESYHPGYRNYRTNCTMSESPYDAKCGVECLCADRQFLSRNPFHSSEPLRHHWDGTEYMSRPLHEALLADVLESQINLMPVQISNRLTGNVECSLPSSHIPESNPSIKMC